MRHAAFLLLTMALVPLPVATALSAEVRAETAVAADATLPTRPAGMAVEDVVDAVAATGLAPTPDLILDLAAVSVQAEVGATADVDPGLGSGLAGDEGASRSAPSSDAVAPAAVAVVAVPITLVAVGVAAGGLGARTAQGALASWSARALHALLGLLPVGLFSRIERSHLMDNPVRARVHDAVAQDPGLSTSEIQARAGVAWGTTIHHLRRLESNGLLVSLSQGANRRYFVANTPAAAQRAAIAALLQPTARRIATLVAAQPGIDQSGLCQALGLNPPSASKHLGEFRGQGLVRSERVGRRTVHHPTPVLHAALGLLAAPSPPMAWPRVAATRVEATGTAPSNAAMVLAQ